MQSSRLALAGVVIRNRVAAELVVGDIAHRVVIDVAGAQVVVGNPAEAIETVVGGLQAYALLTLSFQKVRLWLAS